MAVRFKGGKAVPVGGKLPTPDPSLRGSMYDASGGLLGVRQALNKGVISNPNNPKAQAALRAADEAERAFYKAWKVISEAYNWD